MKSPLLPGFSSLGFRLTEEPDAFGRFLDSVWAVATPYPSATGETRLLEDEDSRVWLHLGDDSSVLLESGSLPGVVGYLERLPDPKRLKLWVRDLHSDNPEPVYPLCLQTPHPWHGTLPEDGTELRFSVTLLAQEARFFTDVEALKADADHARFSETAVIPTGLFHNEGGEPGNHAFVIGRVLLATRPINGLTAMPFWKLRVRTLGGEVWIALPDEAVESDPNGMIVAAQGTVTGSCPDLTPQPLPEPPREESTVDAARTEAAVKQGWARFTGTPEFDSYFGWIHPGKLAVGVLSGISLFNRGARDSLRFIKKQAGRPTPELRRRYQSLHETGHVIFARIVMANTMLLEEGNPGPALVVLAFGDNAEDVAGRARDVLSRVHFHRADDAREAELATLIEDEDYLFGRRRPLPKWLVGDVEAYAADLWIPGEALHHETLRMEVIVCLAEPGPQGLTTALPSPIIEAALSSGKQPPPLPARTTSGPPPMPPQ